MATAGVPLMRDYSAPGSDVRLLAADAEGGYFTVRPIGSRTTVFLDPF